MQKILIVEGFNDKIFFNKVLKHLNLHNDVTVITPKNGGGYKRDGKNNAYKLLEAELPSAKDKYSHIAIIIDADTKHSNDSTIGIVGTINKLSAILSKSNYTLDNTLNQSYGLFFNHDNGLNPVSAWIMPDNRNDGTIEDLLTDIIHKNEQDLFQHASSIVSNLPRKPFKNIHIAKANLATFQAWQDPPASNLSLSVLDHKSEAFKNLCKWLQNIFN